MPGKAAFFDTSAVVSLCLAQPHSQTARQAYRRFTTQIVASTTLIEAASAIYRAMRIGDLAAPKAKIAMDRLVQLGRRWVEIEFTDRTRTLAIDVLERYDLRAGDAIQLASALVWCNQLPRNRWFVCFDSSLSAAAVSVGFVIIS